MHRALPYPGEMSLTLVRAARAVRRGVARPAPTISRCVALVRGVRELRRVHRALRRRYHVKHITAIDARDELLMHIRDTLGIPTPAARAVYLQRGEVVCKSVEQVLANVGRPLQPAARVLDFACGYGRVTRFVLARIPAACVTVSDISHDAVEFVRSTFGVRGFDSVADPGKLQHDETYDVVLVVSLFSHLSLAPWRAWLRRLARLVASNGVLLFSVHGPHLADELDETHRAWTTMLDDGFRFGAWNETRGRLAGEYYGTAYVSEAFVRRVVAEDGLGALVGTYPNALGGRQDVYVLRR
jgi:SAM-dependent methyltransferase